MINNKTVFVIGSGASQEIDLPTGQALSSEIANLLNIKVQGRYELLSGSHLICDALNIYAGQNGERDIHSYLYAGQVIRDAAPLGLSIDNFIDAHRGNSKVELCGKLAIAESILTAERRSKLYLNPHENKAFNASVTVATWYQKLFQVLTEGVDKSKISAIFDNVTFVIFNYDRCVEHFLVEALRIYYAARPEEIQRILKTVSFIHPYGTVSDLSWSAPMGISYGAQVNGAKLLEIASQLRTFTEQSTDEVARNKLGKVMQEANTIVFLGFAYHEQNMKLLATKERGKATRVFGTALGVSKSDCEVIRSSIFEMLRLQRNSTGVEIRDDLRCVDLFDQYWRSLRAS